VCKCPKCGGMIVERKTRRGKLFYGCGNFPKCKVAVWDKPTGELCPECNSLLVTDKDGIIKLTLTSGPHSVKTAENAEEAYVNNICGQGTVEYRGEEEVLFPTLVLE
jgi:ssDNA-binding Zn-finger/Zn-ribbon topoisomerase 1